MYRIERCSSTRPFGDVVGSHSRGYVRPVGLPSNILLRTEKFHRRRHEHDSHKQSSIIPPANLNSDAPAQIAASTQLIGELKEQYKEDEIQGVIKYHPENISPVLWSIVPQYIQALPSNMMSAKRFITDAASVLLQLGLQQILTSHVFSQTLCTEKSSEAEIIVCVTDTVTNISRLIQIGVAVLTLNFRVLVGGRMAEEALVRLNTLAANPLNKTLMKVLGSTVVLYITLMRESVTDDVKGLAGSVMTELTSLPVISNVPDISSGGFGRVNVFIPRPSRVNRADYDIAKLRAGAGERDLLSMNTQ
ncbi:putative membrane protein [Babesia divergens]|uniref:Membrane protein n=1 Tax=Babesia divergens TaxID=32595 RepID=A0AAD9LIA1_BABDI|nr:putative membrane protein [Babesia divergens]